MSDKVMFVDARGLSCPQPVVLTKNAVEKGEKSSDGTFELVVLVDTVTSRENVRRFAERHGLLISVEPTEEHFTLKITKR